MRLVFGLCFVTITIFAQSVKIKSVLSELPTSIRGLSVVDDKVAWFSGSKGMVGKTTDGGKTWKYNQLKNYEAKDFRSLYAFDSLTAIIACVGSSAVVLKTADGGKNWRVVYQNSHPDIFIDGIDFWDNTSGMIYGDPIEGALFLLKSDDGGNTWTELKQDQRPMLDKNEASFAASGTGIRCFGKDKVVLATGGLVSKLLISNDRGYHWQSASPPILQGKSSTGIFSVGIHKKAWIVVGGDFSADSISTSNAFYSSDNAKSWMPPVNSTRGYRSSVEFISENKWLAVGQGGVDISIDNGKTWQPFSNEKGLHVVRKSRKGNLIIAAGSGRVVLIQP